MLRRTLAATIVACTAVTGAAVVSLAGPAEAAAAHKYANCTALNKKYPHGVGRTGARDHVSGRTKPVTNFTRNNAVYTANSGRDRDKDRIACEKR